MKRGEKVFWVLFAIFCFPFFLMGLLLKMIDGLKR